jgi:hypothetical protein
MEVKGQAAWRFTFVRGLIYKCERRTAFPKEQENTSSRNIQLDVHLSQELQKMLCKL